MHITFDRAQWLEKQYDKDGNGRMDFDEFKVICVCVCVLCVYVCVCVYTYINTYSTLGGSTPRPRTLSCQRKR